MGSQAKGTFEIVGWDAEDPYDEHESTALARVRVTKDFTGGLAGTSFADLITVHTSAGPAAYVGIERVTGVLDGREGGFVLQHSAGAAGGEQWLKWLIVAGTGTGELTGLSGAGTIEIASDGTHSYTLEYELPSLG